MNESALTREIIRKIRLEFPRGVWFYKASDRFNKGIPDIIMCFKGRFVAIEVKRHGEQPDGFQAYNIQKINLSGGVAFTAYAADAVIDFLKTIKGIK